MKIEKLSSGSYRVRKQINGKRHTLVFDHKPTQIEIFEKLNEKMNSSVTLSNAPNKTFEECANKYMESKSNSLSASTLYGYSSILKNLDDSFKKTKMCDIDNAILQNIINEVAGKLSAKTTHNYSAFISAVIKFYIPKFDYNVSIREVPKRKKDIPTSKEIKKILKASNDKYYIVFMLGCYGLRRSEVCALDISDIDFKNNTISINKSMVRNKEGKFIIQNFNKTKESTREVPVSKDLIDRIKKQGYVFNGYPGKILEYLHRKQDQLGIFRFTFHDLRHYFATELDQAGFSSKDIQKLGGWSSDNIMKTVYQHNRVEKDKAIQKKAATLFEKNLK